jgi:hypothetical protein
MCGRWVGPDDAAGLACASHAGPLLSHASGHPGSDRKGAGRGIFWLGGGIFSAVTESAALEANLHHAISGREF